MKWWKIVLLVLGILAVLAAAAFFWGKSVFNKISFGKPKLQGLDLKGITLAELASAAFAGQAKTVTVTLGMDITNAGGLSIPFRIYKIKLLHNDETVGESSDALSAQRYTLPKNGYVSISDTLNVFINDAGGQLLIEKIKGGHPEMQYQILFSIFGIPVPYKGDSFTW